MLKTEKFENGRCRASKGVYKIKGVQITTGGDDEPLIYAMGWAEKTNIKTLKKLRKAVK